MLKSLETNKAVTFVLSLIDTSVLIMLEKITVLDPLLEPSRLSFLVTDQGT